jgi:hypothetical protein
LLTQSGETGPERRPSVNVVPAEVAFVCRSGCQRALASR